MGITTAATRLASSFVDAAVDGYRSRLLAQLEQRRLDSLRFSLLISASVATVGMVVDAIALQVRIQALQSAVEEAAAAGDLVAAEQLRGQLVAAMEEPSASAELMATLAQYIPFMMAGQSGGGANVIEGDIVA